MQNKVQNIDFIFKQYEICVDMADKISQRRGISNHFYSALLLAFVSAIALIFKDSLYESAGLIIILSLLGIAFSVIWILNIKSYKTLNKSKFKVIFEMEKLLPYNPYSKEWDYIAEENKYIRLTKIETLVPTIFIMAFVLIGFYAVAQYF